MIFPELLIWAKIQFGNYKERKTAEHLVTISKLSYSQVSRAYKFFEKDPEVAPRLKRAAWVKFKEEKHEKYFGEGVYGSEELMNELMKKEFEYEFRQLPNLRR